MSTADVVVVGGGVIGLTIAYELAGQGRRVAVFDRSQFGSEASWAGAGMLPPGDPAGAKTPEARLRAASHVRWADLSARLLEQTGIDNGFRRCGGIQVLAGENSAEQLRQWHGEGVIAQLFEDSELRTLEPELNHDITTAYHLPQMCQVRNPRHVKALLAACIQRDVELNPFNSIVDFETDGERVIAVRTASGRYEADQFVVAGGAWSKQLLDRLGIPLSIEPVRGQIALLASRPGLLKQVIELGPRYLVPRPDGRILVGSTEEYAGFDKRSSAQGVSGLLQLATRLVPALADAQLERSWAGLRPRSRDGLPYLGFPPGWSNLIVAAGHFRAGLQLSPATGLVVSELLAGNEPSVPLEGFACDRHDGTPQS